MADKPLSPEIYRYTAEFQYIKDNKTKKLDERKIKSIVIDSDYENKNMPMIFLNISLDRAMLDDMLTNMNKALVNLTIYKYISDADNTIGMKTIYLREQFVYFLSDDINSRRELDKQVEDKYEQEELYKNTYIGLMKLDHLNNNKKFFNGVFTNTTMINLIQYGTGHLPILIEPLENNSSISNIIVPPIDSVSKYLRFLNSVSTFYNSSYRFFMDFSTSYLLSSKGVPVIKKGEKNAIQSVAIYIREAMSEGGRVQGMYTDKKQKTYQVDVNALNTTLTRNTMSEKLFNKVKGIGSNKIGTSKDLDINKSEYIKQKDLLIRVPNDNMKLVDNYANKVMNSAVQITVNKNDVDASIFTLNKEYIIKSFNVYDPDTDGKYLLTHKRELYIRQDETFVGNVMLTFNQIRAK